MHKSQSVVYNKAMKLLHGSIFILVVIQIILGVLMGDLPKGWNANAYMLHKSLGIVIFFVALAFIVVRLFSVKPAWNFAISSGERYLAWFVHVGLYIMLLVMPLSGWIMSTAANRAPVFFGWQRLPFPGISNNAAIASVCHSIHLVLAWVITIFIVVHIIGALKHQFFDHTHMLKRMW